MSSYVVMIASWVEGWGRNNGTNNGGEILYGFVWLIDVFWLFHI